MNYFNPQTQTHETLKLISKDIKIDPTASVRTTTEIYETSEGNFAIFTTLDFLKVKSEPYKMEHGITRQWFDAICKAKEEQALTLIDHNLKVVNSLLSEDYKLGFAEGIQSFRDKFNQ